jgi:hypothetical protein
VARRLPYEEQGGLCTWKRQEALPEGKVSVGGRGACERVRTHASASYLPPWAAMRVTWADDGEGPCEHGRRGCADLGVGAEAGLLEGAVHPGAWLGAVNAPEGRVGVPG